MMYQNKFCIYAEYDELQFYKESVLDALYNERNLTLISSNSSKRADLIHSVFRYLNDRGADAITYYVDISDTNTQDDFSHIIAKTILGKDASLQETFHYLSSIDKRVYMAIDNFQQILQYPKKGTDALIRSYVQQLFNVTFIFAGNNEHNMYEMFMSPANPFYHSTQIFKLR